MRKIFFTLSLIIILASCEKSDKFTIEGNIKNAQGNILYLEQMEVSGVILIDSVKLNASGNFRFKKERPVSPDFYRLRLNKQSIDLAIDSTETIKVQADSATFVKDYVVEGSENCIKMKELSILRTNTANELYKLNKSFKDKEIKQEEYFDQVNKAIDAYKKIAQKYIIENPGSPVAYYALLQTIDGAIIFDPFDKADNRLYGAVATQWDFHYPESPLGKHIKNISLRGMKAIRADRPVEYKIEKTVDIFDINLSAISGDKLRLSQISQGKITLLEFCSYFEEGSPVHNMLLAKVYEKYKNKGFQIYQVSLDTDEHAWKNAASNLPWICVWEPQSVYSEIVRQYNVRNLPCGYILDKEGEIALHIDSYENLEADIAKFLK